MKGDSSIHRDSREKERNKSSSRLPEKDSKWSDVEVNEVLRFYTKRWVNARVKSDRTGADDGSRISEGGCDRIRRAASR